MDYAKLDFVVHDRTPYLIDVNTTPTVTGSARTARQVERSALLADGISYFERQAR